MAFYGKPGASALAMNVSMLRGFGVHWVFCTHENDSCFRDAGGCVCAAQPAEVKALAERAAAVVLMRGR